MALMRRPQALEQYCLNLELRFDCIGLDVESAQQAGKVRAHLRKMGTPIGEYDLLIAGIALAHKLTVVTHNTRVFGRVPGLQVKDWYEAVA